jgi:SAM-dependent methyltransferase
MKSSDSFSSAVYYSAKTYWNDIPLVHSELQRRATGNMSLSWQHFLLQKRGIPFQRALSINCGNGWVERSLMDSGVIISGVGTDLFQNFVDDANAIARNQKMNLTYMRHNANFELLPPGPFDLVINFAAAHHVSRINFLFKQIFLVLQSHGWFVCWEYVGAHRNQYDAFTWQAVTKLNNKLPNYLRQNLSNTYPHLPTMLHFDPSEAQHSELILETIRKYFFIRLLRPLGGALAYPILTHNKRFHQYPHKISEHFARKVMEADARWMQKDTGRSLFSFIIATPLRGGVPNSKYSALLQQHEDERERSGLQSVYYTAVDLNLKDSKQLDFL